MSRRLHLFILAAVPALLAACDSSPSTLSKAKPGECYAVVGRDAAGKPKLSKTPCPGSPAAIAAACPAPASGASGAATSGVTCPTPATQFSTGLGGHGVVVERRAGGVSRLVHGYERRQVVRSVQARHHVRRTEVVRGGQRVFHGEYARIDEGLAGGPSYGRDHYEHREYARRDDDTPPPRVYDRYESRDRSDYADSHREAYGYEAESHAYSGGARFHAPPPPPPVYEHRAYGEGSVQYSERQRSSSSYRAESYSASSSSSHSSVETECGCENSGHGRQGNPSPFDRNGFLTWRGKTPG